MGAFLTDEGGGGGGGGGGGVGLRLRIFREFWRSGPVGGGKAVPT